jgi:hypothetical protein
MLRSTSRTLLIAALSAMPSVIHAQTASFGSGTAVGVTVQAIGTSDGWAEVPAVGFHVTSIRPSRLGVDVTVGTVPSVLAAGALLLAPDVGIGYVFPIGGGALMLKGGPSGVLVGGEGGGGGVLGFHAGAIAFVRLARNFGIRAEVVPRFYSVEGEFFRLTTFGIGLTSLPAPAR